MNRLQSQSRFTTTSRRGTTANTIIKPTYRQCASLNVSDSDSDTDFTPASHSSYPVPLTTATTNQFVDTASVVATVEGSSDHSSPSLNSMPQQHQQQDQPLNLTLRSNSEATFSMHESTRFLGESSVLQPSSYGIESIMPEVITDQSAVHAVTKSFNRQMLPDVLRTALSQYYDTAAAKLKEEEHSQSFRWGDELKFLLREWNFIFMAPVSDTTSASPPSESQPLSRLGSGTFSRQSSFSRRRRMSPGKTDHNSSTANSTPIVSTLIPVPPPATTATATSAPHSARPPQSEKMRTVSFTASVRENVLSRDPALTYPNPLSLVSALSAKLRNCSKPTPTSVRVENVPLGSSPYAVGALLFRGVAHSNASLTKLSLCFCNLTTSSLLILMAGLAYSFQSGTQSSLTDLDLSYNQLTPQSLHVFSMFLKQTRIMSLSLRGNPIGGVQQQNDFELQTNFGDASPSDPDSGDEGSVRSSKAPSNKSPLASQSKKGGAVAASSLTRSALKQFVHDCVSSFETLDLSFTALSTDEIEVIIDKIHELPILRFLSLDGLAITQGTAAKLAVAVKFSPSLWNVSVRYNFACSSESYLEKLNSSCNARKERAASSRRSRRALNRSSMMAVHSSVHSFSLKPLAAAGKFADVDIKWVDTNALSEGYSMYTTNDPSVQARRIKEIELRHR